MLDTSASSTASPSDVASRLKLKFTLALAVDIILALYFFSLRVQVIVASENADEYACNRIGLSASSIALYNKYVEVHAFFLQISSLNSVLNQK